MIADAVIAVIKAVVEAIAGLLTALFPAVPAWVDTAAEKVGQVTGVLYALDSWVPVNVAFNVAGAIVAAYAASLLIGIIRVVVSYFTAGGGAT